MECLAHKFTDVDISKQEIKRFVDAGTSFKPTDTELDIDGENISKLVNIVLDFSLENLHKNGCVVVKAFETGHVSSEFRKKLAQYFKKVWLRKPLASKNVSSERFLIAKTLK